MYLLRFPGTTHGTRACAEIHRFRTRQDPVPSRPATSDLLVDATSARYGLPGVACDDLWHGTGSGRSAQRAMVSHQGVGNDGPA